MLKNTTIEIETGSIIRLNYGIGSREEFGVLVEIKAERLHRCSYSGHPANRTSYKILTHNGEDHWTSNIHTSVKCETNPNGSPIGAFLA